MRKSGLAMVTATAIAAASVNPAAASGQAVSAQAPDLRNVPLIPRTSLFGNPVKSAGRISPDAKSFAFIAPRDGVYEKVRSNVEEVKARRGQVIGVVSEGDTVLCLLDARINEIYSATAAFEAGIATLREGPFATAPGDLASGAATEVVAVGDGCKYLDQAAPALQARIRARAPDIFPDAADMFPQALANVQRGIVQSAAEVQPVYVRDEISWKKLAEQGRQV